MKIRRRDFLKLSGAALSGTTGGLTSAHPLEPGRRISASFGHAGWSVEVRRPGLPGFMIVDRNGRSVVETGHDHETRWPGQGTAL